MKLIYDNNGNEYTISTVTEKNIESVLRALDPDIQSYVIVESQNRDYIQCAGSIENLVVEVRLYTENSFKHFILGLKDKSKVWHTINCRVGPIRVLGHEDMNIENALEAFEHFYLTGNIKPEYNKRNVTRQFK